MQHVGFTLLSIGVALALFLGMVLFIELGRRLAIRQSKKLGAASRAGVGSVDSAVYAVLALLLGFTFSGAASRFDQRREFVVQQVSSISTAWQRIEVLPHDTRAAVRAHLRDYLDALVATYSEAPGTAAELRNRERVTLAERDLWADAVTATSTAAGDRARTLLLPALNELFDAVDRDRLAQRIHPPILIWVMLAVSAMAAALFAGYAIAGTSDDGRSKRNWFHVVGVAATISITAFVILELESPRLGLIRMDGMDRALVELRQTME